MLLRCRSFTKSNIYLIVAICCGLLVSGCESEKAATVKQSPAKLVHPDEGDIYRVVLTPKAEQRLQISTVAVEKKAVPRSRIVGGTITVPDGSAVLVTAPISGTLQIPQDTDNPTAGHKVSANQPVFDLLPLLPPELEVPSAAERVSMADAMASLVSAQIIAEGDVKQGEAQVEAAQIAMTRTMRLVNDKVGSQRDLDDAQARLDLAQKALEAAQARKTLLDELSLQAETKQPSTLNVQSPQDGILRNVTSSVGQLVSVGSPLFEVVNLDTMWVRIPVYPGLSMEVDRNRGAALRKLGDSANPIEVQPVVAPPSGDPLATTIDLFYHLPNQELRFAPGEAVEIALPLQGESESLVVPRAAILRDIHGIAWVYVNSAEHEFRRHRVEVKFTTDALAVLNTGPSVGELVVVDGVAELFGTEFGAGK